MNILRWHRKSKKKISWKKYILFIFSLIMTTFAWFAYSKILNTSLDLHIAAWDITYAIDGESTDSTISLDINDLYPTMPEETITVDIQNNGEALVDLDYHINKIILAGTEYELVTEGNTNTQPNYIEIGTPVIQTNPETGESFYTGQVINDLTRFPFTVEVEHSAQVVAGGQAYLTVTTNWLGNQDELDSDWGYIVGTYLMNNPGETALSIELSIDSYQTNDIILAGAGTLPSATGTKPYLPNATYSKVEGTDLDTGLMIQDADGNQYVWIEVPKLLSTYGTAGIELTEFEAQDYINIETDLKNYVSDFRGETTASDTYFSDDTTGLTSQQYTELKNKMLKSVYQNGGFYIARYEAGMDTYRTSHTSITGLTLKSQPNKYPLNWVTCGEAQQLASKVLNVADRTSSLMFGIQWDLVLKYLENKGISDTLLATNSTTWGNYNATTFSLADVNKKLSTNNGSSWLNGTSYNKGAPANIMLTTGAVDTFAQQNIYDFAGNLWEWTLEYSGVASNPSSIRGGAYESSSTENNANCRSYSATAYYSVGFRVSIY